MFGLKRKPLSPEMQRVYDAEYKAKLAAFHKQQRDVQVQRVRLAADRAAERAMTPKSRVIAHGLVEAGKKVQAYSKRFDPEKLDNFVLGEKAKKKG